MVTIRPTATGKGVEFATHTDTQPGPGDKGTVQMVIKDGNVGIGEPDPKHRLTVVGGVYCSGELDVGAKATAKELEVTGNTRLGQISSHPDRLTKMPGSWGGVHTWDVYAEGSIGCRKMVKQVSV